MRLVNLISRQRYAPALSILILAPLFGEVLSTASSPINLLLPWNLAIMVGLYGCGALLCRELWFRYKLGFLGLCLLGMAYGIYEEGLIDRFWFDPAYWKEVGIGSYSAVGPVNVLIASHLTLFHMVVSIGISILVVEWLFPQSRKKNWATKRGLVVAALALFVFVPFMTYESFPRPSWWALLCTALVCAACVAGAFLCGRMPKSQPPTDVRARKGLAAIAFAAAGLHFFLVYAAASFALPWPVSLAIAFAPVVFGALLIKQRASSGPLGPSGMQAATGIISFFLVLDFLVGLAGSYDLTLFSIAGFIALGWLRKHRWPSQAT